MDFGKIFVAIIGLLKIKLLITYIMENMEEQKQEQNEVVENQEEMTEETMEKSAPEIEKETSNQTEESKTTEEKTSFFKRKNSKETKLKEELDKLEVEKKELNDKFLRLYSEFDNYKKRTNKEKLDILATASKDVVVSMLPIIDDFERAIAANEKTEDLQIVKDGFTLIYNKLQSLLTRLDVAEIEAKGNDFDTDLHEAVAHFPTEDEGQKGKVIDVVEKGYKMKDKVIRFAKVVVAN